MARSDSEISEDFHIGSYLLTKEGNLWGVSNEDKYEDEVMFFNTKEDAIKYVKWLSE